MFIYSFRELNLNRNDRLIRIINISSFDSDVNIEKLITIAYLLKQ